VVSGTATIGDSGLYSFLDDGHDVVAETPYGAPTSPVTRSPAIRQPLP
jgi:hypothetical protein